MVEVMRINQKHIQALNTQAKQSNRLRQHHNLHLSFDEPCQRLLNSIEPGSYIRPHRHSLDPKTETLIAVSGLFGLVVFDDDGGILSASRFGTEKYFRKDSEIDLGAELPSGVWHTVLALVPGSILLEVKAGPFDPDSAKEFAPWSPDENSSEVAIYMTWLKQSLK